MLLLTLLLKLILLVNIEGGGLSSFYAPLFPYKIISPDSNIEVSLYETISIPFDPEHGKRFRDRFEKKYGAKGENLIRSFGTGVEPGHLNNEYEQDRIQRQNEKKYAKYKGEAYYNYLRVTQGIDKQ